MEFEEYMETFCTHAFEALIQFFKKDLAVTPIETAVNEAVVPVFIKWTVSETKEIRGDMGSFSPERLVESLNQVSLIAALQDRRYKRIKLVEIPSLTVCVEIIDSFENVTTFDWEIGKHGVNIKFELGGVIFWTHCMPSFGKEKNLDQIGVLKALVKQSGYFGKLSLEEILKEMEVTRFTTVKREMSFEEFCKVTKIPLESVSFK